MHRRLRNLAAELDAGLIGRREFLRQAAVISGTAAGLHVLRRTATGQPNTKTPGSPVKYCPYHGYADLPFSGTYLAGSAGRFRTGVQNNRVVMVCPDGHVWPWLMVWRMEWGGTLDNHGNGQQVYLNKKYGDNDLKWSQTQLKRLGAFGFSGTQSYSNKWTQPWASYGGYNPVWVASDPRPVGGGSVSWDLVKAPRGTAPFPQPIPFPGVLAVRPNYYGTFNFQNKAPDAFKNLYQTNPAYHNSDGEHFPDIFDPNYQLYLRGDMQTSGPLNYPWIIGMFVDDTDQLRGFGAGPDFTTHGVPGLNNPHLSWVTAVSKPWVTSGVDANNKVRSYANPLHFTKKALRDFLAAKYSGISALNAQWGSNYTTFDEQDSTAHTSWGSGSGFMDENGRHAWMGTLRSGGLDIGRLAAGRVPAAVIGDLDDFLYEIAKKYFSMCRAEVKGRDPNMLYLGVMDLGTWSAPANRNVLKAAGPYCDMVHGNYMDGSLPQADRQARIDFMVSELNATVPLASWVGFPSNTDSALYMHPGGQPTQQARGGLYKAMLDGILTTASPGGLYQNVGLSWWGWYDQFNERMNWGLVSYKDNAYDGKEAVAHSITDPYGNTTIAEDRDFGDFLTSVKSANAQAFSTYQSQLVRGKR